MLSAAGIPAKRLSSFYFCYFAVLGTWLPYWNLYLDGAGYSTSQIGVLSAVMLGTKIIAPALWGLLAERSGRRMTVIRAGCALTCISLAAVLGEPVYWQMFAIIFAFSFFWNAVLPQFETITVDYLGKYYAQYSRIRLWGSIGFIVAVLGLGQVFKTLSISTLPYWLIGILLLMSLSSFSVAAPRAEPVEKAHYRLGTILTTPAVIAFLVVVALQQFSHGPYYTFYSIYLERQGYDTLVIGALWSLGVFAEIILFALMHRLLPRFGVKAILICSLALSVLRWLAIGTLADHWWVVVLAQLLHAASFGACHSVAIEFIRATFGARQGVGQALYSGVSFGFGGALGAIGSGYLWPSGPLISFGVAALASFIAMIIAWRFIRVDKSSRLYSRLTAELL